jgi:Domain of unknown function (DUF1707)
VDRDGDIRASDKDRERVVETLQTAYTDGRLDLDEFDDRMNAAYAAKTWSDLRELTRDLPVDLNLNRGSGPSPGRPMASLANEPMGRELPPPPARRTVLFPFVPLAIVFLVLAVSVHAAGLLVPVCILAFVGLRLGGRRGRNGGHRPGGGVPPNTGSGPF